MEASRAGVVNGGEPLDDQPGTLIFLVGVGAREAEVGLVVSMERPAPIRKAWVTL